MLLVLTKLVLSFATVGVSNFVVNSETVWRILWYGLAVALIVISPFVLVLYLTISTLNAQLEHKNVKLRESVDRVLRILFVTPNMHKVHHSRAQYQTDTNYSNIFSV